MLNSLKNYFLNKDIRQFNKIKHPYCSLSSAQNIAILITKEACTAFKEKNIKDIFNNKNVFFFIYSAKEEGIKYSADKIEFGSKGSDFHGHPDIKIISVLKKQSFNLWIDLTDEPILEFKYILASAQNGYRCGMRKIDYEVLDLRIEDYNSRRKTDILKNIVDVLNTLQ